MNYLKKEMENVLIILHNYSRNKGFVEHLMIKAQMAKALLNQVLYH